MRYPDPILIRRAPLITDDKGNTRRNWAAATDAAARANVQQIGSTEDVARQQRTESRYDVFCPIGTDVLATDRIVWDGAVHEVVGEPFAWRQGSPSSHHVHLVMRRVAGA